MWQLRSDCVGVLEGIVEDLTEIRRNYNESAPLIPKSTDCVALLSCRHPSVLSEPRTSKRRGRWLAMPCLTIQMWKPSNLSHSRHEPCHALDSPPGYHFIRTKACCAWAALLWHSAQIEKTSPHRITGRDVPQTFGSAVTFAAKLSDNRDDTSMQSPSAKAETLATVAKLICGQNISAKSKSHKHRTNQHWVLEEGSLEICPNLPNFIVETRSTRHRTAHFLHIPWTAPETAESQYQTRHKTEPTTGASRTRNAPTKILKLMALLLSNTKS